MSATNVDRPEIEAAAEFLLRHAGDKRDLLGADVLFFCGKSHSLSLLDGSPEENSCGVSGGISLRCIGRDGRQGVASSNNFSKSSLAEMAEWSYANCLAGERDEGVSLHPGPLAGCDEPLELFDENLDRVATAGFRHEACSKMTEAARARDPKVLSVREASWSDGAAESFYASTSGLSGWRRGTSVACGVTVVMKDGESYELGSYGQSKRHVGDIDLDEAARKAVDRTLMILGGKPLPTGKYTLLLEPETSASIVCEIGDMFCASEVHKGRSLMAGRLGQAVAGPITLVDDARLPRRAASASYDSEGVPTGRTVLIDSGVASAYLYNLQHAAKDGERSTGNASRGLSSLPDVGASNLVLQPGPDSPESLARRVSRGFLVMELMGLHTINPVSGDFSLGAKGVFVENGEFAGPVAGVTIADNLIGFLKKIAAVGNDLKFFGSIGAPTLLVEDVAIAGE